MGYWETSKEGASFQVDSKMIWGDQPADILDEALDKIVKVFKSDVGRPPTKTELVAGFKFSISVYK